MIRTPAEAPPAPLKVAAGVAFVEAIVLLGYALSLLGKIDSRHPQVAITTSIAFAIFATGLTWCAWSVTHRNSWARSPIVLAQLIQLMVAWSFHGSPTTPIAIALATAALIALAGLLHPASVDYLADEYAAED
jgi:hypothetical protein